jgi:hypothetical protein
MGSPNVKYNSGAVPHGGIFIDCYRPIDPENPNGGGVLLGTYRLESISPKPGATLTKRPDIDGGKNGWFIIDQDTEGNALIQRNVATTPTLANGDYFDAGLGVDAAGAVVNERFVVHGPDRPADSGYRKMSLSVIVDTYATGVAPRNPLNGN